MTSMNRPRPSRLLAGLAAAAVAAASCGDTAGDSDTDEGLERVMQEQEHDAAEVPVRSMSGEEEQGRLPGEVVAATALGARPDRTVYDPPPDLTLRIPQTPGPQQQMQLGIDTPQVRAQPVPQRQPSTTDAGTSADTTRTGRSRPDTARADTTFVDRTRIPN